MNAAHFFCHHAKVSGLVFVLWVQHIMSSVEIRCPLYNDPDWQVRDQSCDQGLKYHCFENESMVLASHGCYKEKFCAKGSHPVVENGHIRCAICGSGYQPVGPLPSSTYTETYCWRHGTCRQKFGLSQCRAGTPEVDTGCTCNASLGFSQRIAGEDCRCFTHNDPCSGCKFTGCPQGSIINSEGFCEPDTNIISTTIAPSKDSADLSSTVLTTTAATRNNDEGFPGWATGLIVFCLIAVITLVIMVLVWKKYRANSDAPKWMKRKFFWIAGKGDEQTPAAEADEPLVEENEVSYIPGTESVTISTPSAGESRC